MALWTAEVARPGITTSVRLSTASKAKRPVAPAWLPVKSESTRPTSPSSWPAHAENVPSFGRFAGEEAGENRSSTSTRLVLAAT